MPESKNTQLFFVHELIARNSKNTEDINGALETLVKREVLEVNEEFMCFVIGPYTTTIRRYELSEDHEKYDDTLSKAEREVYETFVTNKYNKLGLLYTEVLCLLGSRSGEIQKHLVRLNKKGSLQSMLIPLRYKKNFKPAVESADFLILYRTNEENIARYL